ncbi:J domain-containing protein [Rubrivirga sp. S365]|uniref:J domain-containing protein n=1 Tax=Rubrivirga litoralis TaxID=3075598 RepID=A0ABU3BTB2_9BACT|nr:MULTISPECIES: J domain-containing protein [unclassified Rubrivirga]MDT0632406.1 J domain-containing protein [Rubrivirga sp. F394]MDT7855223.1 J domain-containing protein [Rubrivirga sp. S365]
MSLVTIGTSFVVVALLAAVVLGWVADLRRTGGAVSAHEARAQAERAGRGGRGRSAFYTSREDRAEAMRERIARERRRRERARGPRVRSPDAEPAGSPADRPPAPPPDAPEARHRRTLELGSGPVTADRLRLHYRRLVTAYHPDRVAGLGAKLQRLAEEETKAINEAYSFFKREIGERA